MLSGETSKPRKRRTQPSSEPEATAGGGGSVKAREPTKEVKKGPAKPKEALNLKSDEVLRAMERYVNSIICPGVHNHTDCDDDETVLACLCCWHSDRLFVVLVSGMLHGRSARFPSANKTELACPLTTSNNEP